MIYLRKHNAQKLSIGEGGFTLIEVIITLVLMAIMASMFSTLFTNPFTQSSMPLQTLQQDVNLSLIMEKMIANYENNPDLAVMKSSIGTEGETKSQFGGTYYVVNNHYIQFNSSGVEETGGTDILKVTIRSTSDTNKQAITYLFATQSAS